MKEFVLFVREKSKTQNFVSLHEPIFEGNEKKYLSQAIDSTFVSTTGVYIDKFEKMIAQITGSKFAVATVNGTSALHLALIVAGVNDQSEVITQPLTFVATCNAIIYTGADPIFIDVDKDTMGLSPEKLKFFLDNNTHLVNGNTFNKKTGKKISACVPMHTFGFPCRIEEIKKICDDHGIILIEDSAESLGSKVGKKSTGTFGLMGVFSFNGNKIVTAGGGGVIITDNENLAKQAKHLSTTSKISHKWEYVHDKIGYNYRLPNINAALLCAQLEQLKLKTDRKKKLFELYKEFFKDFPLALVEGIENTHPNYWLITIIMNNKLEKEKFLEYTNKKKIMTRPIWRLMNKLKMFSKSQCGNLENSKWLEERAINIPSNFII